MSNIGLDYDARLSLRQYQRDAKQAVYDHLAARDDSPCVVIPTGGGKTPVIASICHDAVREWNGRVLILAHVKELLEQHRDALLWVDPWLRVGVYSAALRRRNTIEPIILASIQSVYNKADKLGAFDLVIVDEAHLIPSEGEGMYRSLLSDMKKINPDVRLIGMTATPFRTNEGFICSRDGMLNSICYEIGIKELINQGYLTKLRSKGTRHEIDYKSIRIRAGEFAENELESAMLGVVSDAVEELLAYTVDRKSVLIFTSGVAHGVKVERLLLDRGQTTAFVTGQTHHETRYEAVRSFREGRIKYLVNVNVYTTGFDAPNVDCVALLRATLSPGLYYQMVGRGFRTHPGKSDCLVLDFGGNIDRHGPVDCLRITHRDVDGNAGTAPMRVCPQCAEIVHVGYLRCPDCGYEWPIDETPSIDIKPSESEVMSGETIRQDCVVDSITYSRHLSKKSNVLTMRVDYECGLAAHSEWVCFDHDGYAREKACYWWRKRSNRPVPATSEEAVTRANDGELIPATAITVEQKHGEKFPRIVAYIFKSAGDEFGATLDEQVSPENDDWRLPAPLTAEQLADCPF